MNTKLAACVVAILVCVTACTAESPQRRVHSEPLVLTSAAPVIPTPTETFSVPQEPIAHSPTLIESDRLELPLEPSEVNTTPGGEQPADQLYDTSQTAYDLFYAWHTYETMTTEDYAVMNTDAIYEDGITMCAELQDGATAESLIFDAWNADGYSERGAEALYKASTFALCPRHYQQGYRTDFDYDVEAMMFNVDSLMRWPEESPAFYEYGYLAREVCSYVALYGTRGLEDHLIGLSGKYHEMSLLASIDGDIRSLKVLVHQAVTNVCPQHSMSLGVYWTMYDHYT